MLSLIDMHNEDAIVYQNGREVAIRGIDEEGAEARFYRMVQFTAIRSCSTLHDLIRRGEVGGAIT